VSDIDINGCQSCYCYTLRVFKYYSIIFKCWTRKDLILPWIFYNETSAKHRWQSSRFEGVFNVDWNFVQRYLFYLMTQVEVKQGVKVAIFRKKCIDFRFEGVDQISEKSELLVDEERKAAWKSFFLIYKWANNELTEMLCFSEVISPSSMLKCKTHLG